MKSLSEALEEKIKHKTTEYINNQLKAKTRVEFNQIAAFLSYCSKCALPYDIVHVMDFCNACNNHFCRLCAPEGNCLNCRKQPLVRAEMSDIFFVAILARSPIAPCPKCHIDTYTGSFYKLHAPFCNKKIACPLAGCEEVLDIKLIHDHARNQCTHRHVKCPSCTATMPVYQLDHHLEVVPHRCSTPNCTFKGVGRHNCRQHIPVWRQQSAKPVVVKPEPIVVTQMSAPVKCGKRGRKPIPCSTEMPARKDDPVLYNRLMGRKFRERQALRTGMAPPVYPKVEPTTTTTTVLKTQALTGLSNPVYIEHPPIFAKAEPTEIKLEQAVYVPMEEPPNFEWEQPDWNDNDPGLLEFQKSFSRDLERMAKGYF